jgi:hypothetical protein
MHTEHVAMLRNLLMLSALVGAGCVPNTSKEIVFEARAPRLPEGVVVTRARPAQRHHVVAVLSVHENMRVEIDDVARADTQISLLRMRGARLGCDAIVVSRADMQRCGRQQQCFEAYGHRADCVVWDDDPSRGPSQCLSC